MELQEKHLAKFHKNKKLDDEHAKEKRETRARNALQSVKHSVIEKYNESMSKFRDQCNETLQRNDRLLRTERVKSAYAHRQQMAWKDI